MTAGPFETEREARRAAVAQAAGGDVAAGRPSTIGEANHRLLCEALTGAVVELGAWDHRIVQWLSQWEPATVAVIAGLITRAHQAGGPS